MFGRILVLIISVVSSILVACAHPNYAEPVPDQVEQQLGSCDLEFKQSKLCASFAWDPKPTEEKKGSFVLEFHGDRDASQFADLLTPPGVVLWMPSMGHGSSPVTVEHIGDGMYRASNVFFVMRGDWEIKIQIKNANAVVEEVVLPVRF